MPPALVLLALAQAPPPFYADKADLLHSLDDRGRRTSVKSPADWKKRRDHVLENMQLVMGKLPTEAVGLPLDLKVEREETLPRVVRKKASFVSAKGERVSAYLL